MPQTRTINVQFPSAGVVRRQGLRASTGGQGPFPAPWATNVRLQDGVATRLRGGNFTGISAGSRPSSIRYRDRTLTTLANVVKVSRAGDDGDFAISADLSDTLRPARLQFSHNKDVGPSVVALVPHKGRYLLGFTAGETWVLHGDPHLGTLRQVSSEVGIIGANAWCVAEDTVYFLSARGLYSVGADGSGLRAISEDKIPEDLSGLSDTACTLTYQHSDRGVYIHLTADPDWFYDTARDQFWPFDTDTTDSHALFGPFYLGQTGANYGRVQKLHGNIATGSDDVSWRLVVGNTAEAAAANGKAAIEAAVAGNSYASYVAKEGTWTAGRSNMAYPRTRAVWCCVWLHSEGDWAFEEMILVASHSGTWR